MVKIKRSKLVIFKLPLSKDRKYEYQLNYVRAFHIIRNYLKEKGGKNPPDIESLIAKEILPIRPNRQNERKVKAKSPVSFNYRYD